ncbi:metal dependent phosphohydrolase [Desulfovibrio sp. X2]|uniref:HD-GYP domain-containing protein n=1 Tax=Desulfovibrio sp. X2 TaxID=941449 RepID=UPI000358E8AB|nr:HD-GYP domain-containing protein [Desulfovibrio sp. X2]EPR44140.1 metal dependent phosphohydrolase [Desulfovibrio sp. X2]
MAEFDLPEYRVSVDQLEPGVFIRLENVRWFEHPFLFNSFKIKNQEQISILRQIGVSEVICVPERSDRLPGRHKPESAAPAPAPEKDREAMTALWEEKKARAERLQKKRERIARCEERYASSIKQVTEMLQGIVAGRTGAIAEAARFVAEMTEFFLSDAESTLHLINVMGQVERIYYHSLNVAVLSLMLGQKAGLDADSMNALGMAALFHDVGKARIEKKLLRKRGQLSTAERAVVERHPLMGADILSKSPDFPKNALEGVTQHHERFDGSGYPRRLTGAEIGVQGRILAICDVYDNHCNHPDPLASYTPYQALSYMFTQQKGLFDPEMLALFIRCLGVYPPGTVVQLTNGSLGMVVSVNPDNQLNPSVLVYDPDIPRKSALIIDLGEESELAIEKSIRINHLPSEILDYLSLRSRITYTVELADG